MKRTPQNVISVILHLRRYTARCGTQKTLILTFHSVPYYPKHERKMCSARISFHSTSRQSRQAIMLSKRYKGRQGCPRNYKRHKLNLSTYVFPIFITTPANKIRLSIHLGKGHVCTWSGVNKLRAGAMA